MSSVNGSPILLFMKILILNGSPKGESGNCADIIRFLKRRRKDISFGVLHLAKTKFGPAALRKIKDADGLLFLTGTYWDSWGSPLQKFLEDATELEAREEIMGKPAAVCVLMHSVGGKSVLSRLQGVLSSMGFLIPPMSGVVLSLNSQMAQGNSKKSHNEDFWSLDDMDVLLDNLSVATACEVHWKAWPVDRKNFRKTWLRFSK